MLNFNPDEMDFLGKNGTIYAIGVVEETGADPLGLGRVKARYYGFHPEDTSDVPTKDLPWSQVLRPATNLQMPAVAQGDTVFAIFLDGKSAQYPMIMGIVNSVNRPSNPNLPGNSSTLERKEPYNGQGQENPEKFPGTINPPNTPNPGASTGDSGANLPVNGGDWTKDHPELKNFGPFEKIHLATYQALVNAEKMSGEKQTITSAYRNSARNRKAGGAGGSMHLTGRAFDIKPAGKKFIQAAVKCGFTGFGAYSFDEHSTKPKHIDTGNPRTWGPTRRSGSTPKWFLRWLTEAGWSHSKKPLEGVRTNPGTPTADNTTDPNNTTNTTNETPGTSSSSETRTSLNTSSRDDDAAVQTILGEAGTGSYLQNSGGGVDGQIAVANVIRNRMEISGQSAYDVVSAKSQFDGYYVRPLSSYTSEQIAQAREVWDGVRNGTTGDNTGGADHFHATYVNPSWRNSMPQTAQYGAHLFYNSGGKFAGGNPNRAKQPGFNGSTWAQNHKPGDTGKPAVASIARGMNATVTSSEGRSAYDGALDSINGYATGTLGGFSSPGGEEPWNEPQSGLAPVNYDMMTVLATKSHPSAVVVNDVAGSETILVHHGKTGSKIEMGHNGDDVYRTRKDAYFVSGGNMNHGSSGDMNLSAKGAMKIASQETNIQSDGSLMIVALNDGRLDISGKMDISAGENIQLKATRVILEAQNISFFASENMSFEAGKTISLRAKNIAAETSENINVKSGKDLNMESVENMNQKSAQKINSESSQEMNLKSGSDLKVQSSGVANIKSGGAVKLQGTTVNVKGDIVKVGPIAHIPTLKTDDMGSGASSPDTADSSSGASGATTVKDPMDKATVVAVKAKSTNLGRPSEKTSITADKSSNVFDGSILASAQDSYSAG